jgi:Permuted papain-like amidase enzyme, YaeF/YiiX, C92 family
MVYQRGHNFVEVPLLRLRPKRIEAYGIKGSGTELDAIEQFFTGNVLNTFLMNRGLYALAQGPRDLFASPVKLPILRPISESEWRLRWHELPNALQKLDTIQVFDGTSRISRFLAAVDRGSWSHTAMYSGDGTVIEAITSGVTERSLDVYRRPGVRIGVYRMAGCSPQNADKAIKFARERVGNGYGWAQLLRKGIQMLAHVHPKPQHFIASPNDLIVRTEGMELVFLI